MRKKMDFTTDWFTASVPGIQKSIGALSPQRILEIGSWEGRSACWFLDTFPDASIVCIDTFEGSAEHHEQGLDVTCIKARFLKNTAPFGHRVALLEGKSSDMMFALRPKTFDIVYVDGSHAEADVLSDLVMAYHMLKKPGGIMLVDDYKQPAFPGVKNAVDAFAKAFPVRCILCDYQIHFVVLV